MRAGTKVLEKDTKRLTRLVKKLQNKNRILEKGKKEFSRRALRAEQQVKVITSRALVLEDEIKLLRYKLFGRRSEKYSVEDEKQGQLFNEAEDIQEEEKKKAESTLEVKSYVRRKGGRKPLPGNLPREEIIHDIPEEEKVCSCCGSKLVRIGEEVSEKLEIIPMKIKVIRNIRVKYACNKCDGCEGEKAVKVATLKPQIMPKSIVTPGLLAYILVSKFADGIPFYRQEKQFKRIGVDISRADLSNWAIKAGKICDPFVELFLREIRSGPVVQMDETRVQVLNEYGRANTSKSYIWVMRGGIDPLKPVILYRYHPSRGGEIPLKYLDKYSGFFQTDGYEGYKEVGKRPGIIHAGCWAHVRRKYYEASKPTKKPGSAETALGKIGKIYSIEKDLRGKNLELNEFVEKRKSLVEPILRDFKEWLDKKVMQVPPTTLLGRAVNYTLKQWEKLVRYLDSPYLTPDTNRIENNIRPFVVGRKNWLFSGSPLGAFASTTIYSLIETAKANGLEPYRYLKYLFTELPTTKVEDYIYFMPQYLDGNKLKN